MLSKVIQNLSLIPQVKYSFATIDANPNEKTSIENADMVAWALMGKDEENLVQYPCKFKPLEDNEIRMKVKYTSLCHTDSLQGRAGWFDWLWPTVLGHEIIGQVVSVGKKVKNHKIGDLVASGWNRAHCGKCLSCKNKVDQCCTGISLYEKSFGGPGHFGGFATHYQVPADHAHKVPKGLDVSRAAPLLCAGVTVFNPLDKLKKKGCNCAIIGTGGLGHLAVQYAAKMGMNVTAVDPRFAKNPQHIKLIQQLGANRVLSTDKEIADNAGTFDLCLTTVYIEDSATYNAHVSLTRPGGTFAIVGLPPAETPLKFNVNNIVFNQIRTQGSLIGSIEDFKNCLDFSAKQNVYPVNETLPFDKFPEAWRKMEKGSPKFRMNINVEDWSKKHGFFQ